MPFVSYALKALLISILKLSDRPDLRIDRAPGSPSFLSGPLRHLLPGKCKAQMKAQALKSSGDVKLTWPLFTGGECLSSIVIRHGDALSCGPIHEQQQ